MGPERRFRVNTVIPFLKTLKNSVFFPIQQLALIGDADFYGCCCSRFVALELKANGKKPRPAQQKKLDLVTAAHGVSLVATPSNWENIKRQLTDLDKGAY